ncbi:MAG: DUF3857 domain-containing protein, partial [Candidatus Eisenbacteria bacterium]|nr:DUF3857 domain-containing protein [Candidatus Eisenbacteria bacterium]
MKTTIAALTRSVAASRPIIAAGPLLLALAATPLLLASACPSAAAAPMSAAGGYDIGALLAEAEREFELARQDAVILLEDHDIVIAADGARETTVHRIVWMSTELALESYADLRVPHRSDRSRLEVHTLRTWREGRWWPDSVAINPTAVVETLPGSVSRADEYTALRETMLLHDGVELPCIVETRYTIRANPPVAPDSARGETRKAGRSTFAHDGLWRFAQADPVVSTTLRITAPDGSDVWSVTCNGAPEPDTADSRPVDGGRMRVWHMKNVARIPQPTPADPLSVTPHVVWSCWPSWETLGQVYRAAFDGAARIGCESSGRILCDSLAAALAREPSARTRAQAVSEFVGKWTRPVSVDDGFWSLEPRSALRTWQTAYGHAYDRAVLAAALFRRAGLRAEPLL